MDAVRAERLVESVASGPASSAFVLACTDPTYPIRAFVGNGCFSLVGTPLGTDPALSLAAGVYDHAPGDVPRIAALPAWNAFNLSHGDGWLNDAPLTGTTLHAYRQELDMYRGCLRTRFDWIDGRARTAVDVTAFVSRADPALAVVRLRLVPRQAGRMTVNFALHEWPPPQRLALERIEEFVDDSRRAAWYPGHLLVTKRSPDALSLRAEGRSTQVAVTQALSRIRGVPNLDQGPNQISFDAVPGRAVILTKFVGVAISRDGSDPLPRAHAAVARAAARGYRVVFAEHAAAWKQLWSTDVIVEGDAAMQSVIHAMLFYLLSSIREESESIAPMGLSSADFYGHIFWDADTWMFPVLAVMHPHVARSIVAFRSRTIEAAQRNALANGYRGAMFPWEADERGEETTPRFAAQNARSEIHITGDVALAQWQFYLATGDREWLARHGYPVISEAAEFWVSRVSHDEAADRYHIRNVVSVDESLIGIDDDAYTNGVARRNLEIATAACLELGRTADPRWARIAERLYIPFDAAGERHRTYENASSQARTSALPLLAYPLALPMSERIKRNDLFHTVDQLQRWRKRAMMTSVLYPVVAAELGEQALVDRLLPTSYEGHLRGPFHVLSERPIDDAVNFVTGAGAFLQQVVFGYTGLRLARDGLRPAFKPLLPTGLRRIVLRNFSIRGTSQDIIVDRERVHFVRRRPRLAPKAIA